MKKCLKCGVEYQDSDVFCPVCGERLAATNVCQRCGRPVTAEETFCRHCGYKIEKEIKCEQCGAVIEEGAKFCQQCGAKVENPIVTVKQRPVKSRGAAATGAIMNPLLKKIFFYAFGGALLLLLSLMFVGCFGDIATARISGRAATGVPSLIGETQGISYFFGDAFKTINQAKSYDDQCLATFLTIEYIFEVLLWLGSLAFIIVGIVLGAVNLAKGAKNEYSLKTKPFVYGLLGGLPYLFIFAMKARMYVKYSGIETSLAYGSSYTATTYSYTLEEIFGWGTTMILVCTILGVTTLVAYNILTAIFERKDIVKHSIRGGIAMALIIALLASIGLVVSAARKDSDYSAAYMLMSPYTIANMGLDEAAREGDPLAGYVNECIISIVFVLFGYGFVQVVINNILNEQKSIVPIIINSAVALFLLIFGHAMGVIGIKNSMNPSSYSASDPFPYNVMFAPGSIVMIIFIVLAVAGYIVSTKIGQKKQEPQIQQ